MIGQWDFSRCEIATFFLARVEDQVSVFKVHVLPSQTVDLGYPRHCFPDSPQVILGSRICCTNDFENILQGRYILQLFLYREEGDPICGITSAQVVTQTEVEQRS